MTASTLTKPVGEGATKDKKKTLIVVHGLTGSGKSTVCGILERTLSVPQTHPIAPMKRHLEQVYQLPPGSLDTAEGKNFKPAGCDLTMHELMVESFAFWARYDPKHSTRMLSGQITESFESNRLVSTQSIRNFAEVDLLDSLRIALNLRLVTLIVTRESSRLLASDALVHRLQNRLLGISEKGVSIENNGTLEDLEERVIKAVRGV